MDPLTASIVMVLGRYALDKGAELGKELGPKALATAKEIFTTTLDRLRGKPDGEFVARKYEERPQTYQEPLAEELDKEIKADPAFAAQLKVLLAQYEAIAGEQGGGTSYRASLKGSGAISQGSGAAAGKGGQAISGSTIHGNITGGTRGSDDEDE